MSSSSKPKSNQIHLMLAFVLALASVFAWYIDHALAYLFFAGASFFFVLFFYNRFVRNDEHRGHYVKSESTLRQAQESTSSFTKADSPQISTEKIKGFLVLITVVGGTIGLVFAFYSIFTFITNFNSDTYVDSYEAYNLGEDAYQQQKYDSAIYYYRQAINADENTTDAWVGLGNAKYMQNEVDSALYFYEAAKQIDETHFQAKYNIAWWYYTQKQYSISIEKLNVLIQEFPDNTEVLQLLGDNYYDQNDLESAQVWYEQAYASGARSRWLCHVLAYLYDKKNQIDLAIPLYKEALEYDNNVLEIHKRLGDLLPGEEGNIYRQKVAENQR